MCPNLIKLNHLGHSVSQPNQVDLMVSAGKLAKTYGYLARARAPHAHVREDNAQKRVENAPLRVVWRGKSAAFYLISGQKQTPCKRVARGRSTVERLIVVMIFVA